MEVFVKKEIKKLLPFAAVAFILYLLIHYWTSVEWVIKTVLRAGIPLICGCIIAFVVNILMEFYKRWFFPKSTKTAIIRMRTPVCMIAAYLTIILLLVGITLIIAPQLLSCLSLMISKLPALLRTWIAKLTEIGILPDDIGAKLAAVDWVSKVTEYASVLISGIGNVAGALSSVISSIFGGIFSTIIAVIFSVYILIGKKGLFKTTSALLKKCMRPRVYSGFCYVVGSVNTSFKKYIIGQCTEAIILGSLCALGMLIFGFPYVAMISSLVAFTALIPIAGGFIGGGIGAIMIFTVSPIKALFFIIFLIILQELENNLIFPKVVGSSIGMPGIWVLTAITIGGGLAGIPGMIASVPITATIYKIVKEKVLKDQNAEITEMPTPTATVIGEAVTDNDSAVEGAQSEADADTENE